ncbi:hypothetical protein SARC_04394 [Sphaeroforma arctica JP610]|uniref:Uncharacterized protein n=1 Tax=Sphaeroforma arctica JP610 TaxID=667725 RepID=A0A0L0G2I4_9EUKA|nr:hypothetical protein SARC_04394 [Sphaeroforma arctica JP610]KNC83342.1 hypothetical protein SARC_04394 [Sphaeroforma arctica JP610]|eukprot:XP_014157244.1 hypothetical protein SARC_04394 [Sphaeroforma arctica JP610]
MKSKAGVTSILASELSNNTTQSVSSSGIQPMDTDVDVGEDIKDRRRRLLERRRSGANIDNTISTIPTRTSTYKQQEYILDMKKKIAAELVIKKNLPVEGARYESDTITKGKTVTLIKKEMDPSQ